MSARRTLFRCLFPLLLLLLAGCDERVPFNGSDVTGADFGRDFALSDPAGATRRLADFKGKAVVVFFGYTQCPDVCPTTLGIMSRVMGQLGADAARVQVLFISVDPERDTAPLLAAYAPAFHPSFLGLRGDAAATQAAMKEFRVFAEKRPTSVPGHYSVDHTAQIYVFDPAGRLRLIFKHGTPPEPIAADLRLLLAGK